MARGQWCTAHSLSRCMVLEQLLAHGARPAWIGLCCGAPSAAQQPPPHLASQSPRLQPLGFAAGPFCLSASHPPHPMLQVPPGSRPVPGRWPKPGQGLAPAASQLPRRQVSAPPPSFGLRLLKLRQLPCSWWGPSEPHDCPWSGQPTALAPPATRTMGRRAAHWAAAAARSMRLVVNQGQPPPPPSFAGPLCRPNGRWGWAWDLSTLQ
jgi:hypothetical protein